MKGDYSRKTFKIKNLYNSVHMQQGRVQVDADWNEQRDIQNHLTRTQSSDVIGACGVPREAGGFKITASGVGDLDISTGRLYIDGLLCENFAILDADNIPQPVLYSQQPFLPLPFSHESGSISAHELSEEPALYIIYIDVWERHITAIEDRAIREVALGGPDTATRMQTVWQVKLLARTEPELAPPSCWDISDEWLALTGVKSGRLKAQTDNAAVQESPCIIPAAAGYRRLENQLYRVEIHADASLETTTFKWSRDNGIVVSRLLSINPSDNTLLTVSDIGKDAVLNFAPGQWLEVTDEPRILHSEPGIFVRLESIEGNNLKIEKWPGDGSQPVLDLGNSATIRRWDQKGNESINLKDTGGALPLVLDEWIDLEDGVQVFFEKGIKETYKTGDYWLIPARVVGGDVEWPSDDGLPRAVEPEGIKHHYCRLALARWDGTEFLPLIQADAEEGIEAETELRDCRPMFPALTEPDLYYISGDGQEAMPGDHLPQVLRVGVANCNHPVQGAWLKFDIDQEGIGGNGFINFETNAVIVAIDPSAIVKWFIVATDRNGEATCNWTLQSNITAEDPELPVQQVKVELLRDFNDHDSSLDRPLIFGASFGVAWEDQYGGARFPNPPFASLTAVTVEQALDQLRENLALYSIGGDGQETRRANRPITGPRPRVMLPQPLEVRVANGNWFFEGAIVQFSIETGSGSLSLDEATIGTELQIDVTTDAGGIARCFWALDSDSWNQRVNVRMVNIDAAAQKPWPYVSDSVVFFNANLSIAEQVTYDGSSFPDKQHDALQVETVEQALDKVRNNVTLYFVSGDSQEALPGAELPKPLQVRVSNNNWPFEAATVRFNVTDGFGRLIPPATGATVISLSEIVVLTNSDGLAECSLQLDKVNFSQQVTATLQDSAIHDFFAISPIRFNATMSIAKQVFYDSSTTEARWFDINDTNTRPSNVQSALDNIVNNMESGDIGYKVPQCPAAPVGVPLFKELLQVTGATNIKSLWDKLLCSLDASKVPYVPHHKLARWQDIIDPDDPGSIGAHLWSKNFTSSSTDVGTNVAVDNNNDIVMSGHFTGTLNLGGNTLTSNGMNDLYVTKLSADDGTHLWSKRYGSVSIEIPQAMVLDNNGDIIIVGFFTGTTNFGGRDLVSSGSNDIFIVKLSANGQHAWSLSFGGTGNDSGFGVTVDSNNDVLFSGQFSGRVKFGTIELSAVGIIDSFITKVDQNGNHIWSQSFGSAQATTVARDIVIDQRDNIIFCGQFNGVVNFDRNSLTSRGTNDLFIVKLDKTGQHLWSRSFGGTGTDTATAVKIDNANNVLMLGSFSGNITIGNDKLRSSGGLDGYIAKLDSQGNNIWAKSFGGLDFDFPQELAIDSNSNVLFTGRFLQRANFGGEDLISAGGSDIFTVRLSSNGVHQWSQSFGGSGQDSGNSISVDRDDNIVLIGYFSNSISFGGKTLTSTGLDIFIVKLSGTRELPVTVQSAIDTLLENLESSDIRYRGRNVKDVLDQLMAITNNVALPPGTVVAYAANSIPSGWLECNGQQLLNTAFPNLFSAIGVLHGRGNGTAGSFNLPDLRGVFIRGWDNGRGMDSSARSFGNLQLDQIQTHQHVSVAHSHVYSDIFFSEINGQVAVPGNFGSASNDRDNRGYQMTRRTAGVASRIGNPVNAKIGNETRPKNYNLMYCIKV